MKRTSSIRFLAATLGLALTLPSLAEEQRSKAPGPTPPKIDLNTASEKALAANPVIGPETARAIVAARPFKSISDLDRIQGLSAERLEQVRDQVGVSTAAAVGAKRLGEPTREKQTLGAPQEKVSATGRIDVNTASVETLAGIAVIGPELAQRLVAARPFLSLAELDRLEGLTTEQLAQVKASVTLGSVPRAKK